MKCLRTADQFVHTGLEKADEAHQEAHNLLEKWENFALKLGQRRKLLAIVASFYRQTEEASKKLVQIEREIKIEREKLISESSEDDAKSSSSSRLTVASTQRRHSDLSNQLAEITAPGLREGRIILEKFSKDDFEAEHVIKKVYEFSEQVKELKTKLVIYKIW